MTYQLRGRHADRWVRFHSLPGSKRYAGTEDEYEIILDRHRRVLTDLGAQERLYVMAVYFEDEKGRISPDPRHPGAVPWLTIEPDDDSPFVVPARICVTMISFDRQTLDPLLRAAADEELIDVIIAPLDLRWLYGPYDGGADVIAATSHDRDVLKSRYADWLSSHPSGM
ncbi:hypothetical protein HII36_11990 [Nonomuraea sp. NN258]|nr:hypothetical protein [Nonomuraea antri]